MKLYSFFNSSASYRVRIALELKKIKYDLQGVNIRLGEQNAPGYRELNPIALVPALDGVPEGPVGQSLVIIDYLDQKYPEPRLIPQQLKQRVQVLEIAYAIACDIHPVNNMRILKYLSNELQVSAEQKQDWYAHWIAEGLQAVEQLLANAGADKFCVGNTATLADCCLIPQWANAARMNCDLSAYPLCRKVYEHCSSLPEFKAAAPENQPDYLKP
ncbi:maleylacetoacetate isomerase [Saezia sanguinis]|uniref:maleylacetoacetate isomerase n=1 Tax=Saezia sanguinis TaxID=1965230 RepID=UPI00303A095F